MRYTLVLASDGLWTVFGPNIVLKHLSGLLGQGVMRIAKNTAYGTGSESDSPDQLEKKKFRRKAVMALNDNGTKEEEEGTSLQEVCENFCKLIRKRWDEVRLLKLHKLIDF